MTPHSQELSEVLEVSLFGALRVRCQGRSVDHFQTRQTALLLAYLVTYPRRHSRDELVDLLWPDADPASGRPRLSQANRIACLPTITLLKPDGLELKNLRITGRLSVADFQSRLKQAELR